MYSTGSAAFLFQCKALVQLSLHIPSYKQDFQAVCIKRSAEQNPRFTHLGFHPFPPICEAIADLTTRHTTASRRHPCVLG